MMKIISKFSLPRSPVLRLALLCYLVWLVMLSLVTLLIGYGFIFQPTFSKFSTEILLNSVLLGEVAFVGVWLASITAVFNKKTRCSAIKIASSSVVIAVLWLVLGVVLITVFAPTYPTEPIPELPGAPDFWQ